MLPQDLEALQAGIVTVIQHYRSPDTLSVHDTDPQIKYADFSTHPGRLQPPPRISYNTVLGHNALDTYTHLEPNQGVEVLRLPGRDKRRLPLNFGTAEIVVNVGGMAEVLRNSRRNRRLLSRLGVTLNPLPARRADHLVIV